MSIYPQGERGSLLIPKRFAALLLVVFFLATITPRTWASPSDPGYSISVTKQSLSISLTLTLSQNLTAFEKSFSLPQVHSTLEGSNSTDAADIVQAALRLKDPRVQVNSLNLAVESTAWSNQTKVQWFNISLTMEITGATLYRNNIAQTDLSWKSFAVTSAISVGGVEANRIGEKDMVDVAKILAQVTEGSNIFFTYFVHDRLVDPVDFPRAVMSFTALNFSNLAVPVSNWQQVYEPLSRTRSWSLDTGQILGVKFLQRIQEFQEVTSNLFGVLYSVNGKIVAPSDSVVQGDSLTFPVDNFPETLMGVAILSSALLGLGAMIYERRLLRRTERKRSKR